MNALERYERFVVPEGTKKVSYEKDTKLINAAALTIEREDETIGHIVRIYCNFNATRMLCFLGGHFHAANKVSLRVVTCYKANAFEQNIYRMVKSS